jgi:hypothetical protein
MKVIFIIVFAILSVDQVFPAEREEQRIWLGLVAKKKITEHYNLWAETQLRYDETHQTMNQTLNRFGLLRSLNEHHEVGLLFAFIQTGLMKEYRPALHYLYQNNGIINSFSIRNRLEGREIEDSKTISGSGADSLRFRSQIRWAHTLSPVYDIVLWDEPFLNLTHEKWTGNRLIERNRLFLGTRIKSEHIHFEVGYMNQYIPRNDVSMHEHALVFYIFF